MKTKRYYLLLAVGGLLFLSLWYRQGSLMPLPFSYLNTFREEPPIIYSCFPPDIEYEAVERIDSPLPAVQAPEFFYSAGDTAATGEVGAE